MPPVSSLKRFPTICCSTVPGVTFMVPYIELKVKDIPEARIITTIIAANPT